MSSKFDKRFLLLILPVLRTAWPRLQFMMREAIPFMMIILFILSFVLLGQKTKVSVRIRTKFWWMMLWYTMFAASNSIFALFSYGQFLEYHQYATIFSTLSFFCVIYIALINEKYIELRFLMVVALCGVIIAGFSAATSGDVTSRQLLLNSLSRDDFNSVQGAYDAVSVGLGGYGFIYANAACSGIVLLMACSRSIKKWFRIIAWMAFVSMLIIVKKGGLGTAVAVLGLSVVLAIMVLSGRTIRALKIVGILFCIGFMIYAAAPKLLSPLSAPLAMVAESMAPGAIQDRILSASQNMKGDASSYAYQRAQLFMQSLAVFLGHPIVGVGAYQQGHKSGDMLGGHSAIMDMVAQEGLIGVFLIVMFFGSTFKFFDAVSKARMHHNWMALPTIYLVCIFFAMFSNQLAKSVSGLFMILVFGYLAMLMQPIRQDGRILRKYERWNI